MSYPVTQGQMMLRVRQHLNIEGHQQIVTDQELGDALNMSIADWYDLVRATTWGGSYYRSEYPFLTTAAGGVGAQFPILNPPPGSTYPLPLDFLSLISADAYISTNMPVTMRPFQEEQRNMFRWWPVGWLFTTPVYYQLQGHRISFIPAPQAAFQVSLNYVKTAPLLFGPDDRIDSINGWEHFIVLDTCIKIAMKIGRLDLIPFLTSEREMQRERIRSMAPRRDQGAAEQVHEIANYPVDWPF